MVDNISESAIQVVLREVLHNANDTMHVMSMLETLASEVKTRWQRGLEVHKKCVAWYEQNALEVATRDALDTDLVEVLDYLSRLALSNANEVSLRTVGGICRLSEMGFLSVNGSNAIILRKFKEWIVSTIPEKDYIMFGVFCCRGLDPYDTTAIIRCWVNPEV